jgi:hypothetical protein
MDSQIRASWESWADDTAVTMRTMACDLGCPQGNRRKCNRGRRLHIAAVDADDADDDFRTLVVYLNSRGFGGFGMNLNQTDRDEYRSAAFEAVAPANLRGATVTRNEGIG